ncbi:hypothetical protein V6C27_08800 [Peptococcaceae bacterium 1198_IL3148]
MKINVNDRSYSVENRFDKFDEFWNQLVQEIAQKELIIAEVNIDGTVVYDNFYNFIKENMQSATTVSIQIITRSEACQQLIKSVNIYLDNFPPYLEDLANDLYGNPTTATWNKFNQLLDGIEWVVNALNSLSKYLDNAAIYSLTDLRKGYVNLTASMLDAFNNKDYFQLGDLLQYDFIDKIEITQETLNKYYKM